MAAPGPAEADPFALADDGSAVDPAAFQQALRDDPEKLEAVRGADPAAAAVLLGSDVAALQDLLRQAFQVGTCAYSIEGDKGFVPRSACG